MQGCDHMHKRPRLIHVDCSGYEMPENGFEGYPGAMYCHEPKQSQRCSLFDSVTWTRLMHKSV